jgi:DNA-binding NarL/FixJ family response regulator
MMIRIGLAEDVTHLQKAIAEVLANFENTELVFTAANGQEMVDLVNKHKVDLLLMDINMPVMNGIEATAVIRKRFPEMKIVMLTVFDDGDSIFKAILAGANGYLLKDSKPARLIAAIEDAMEGGAPMSPNIATKALQLIRGNRTEALPEKNDFDLTKRELEILEQLATGDTYQEIADKLFISSKTVRKHIENIYGKLQAHNKVEAIQIGQKHGLIGLAGLLMAQLFI